MIYIYAFLACTFAVVGLILIVSGISYGLIPLFFEEVIFQLDKDTNSPKEKCSRRTCDIGVRLSIYALTYPFIYKKIQKKSYRIGMFFLFFWHWSSLILIILSQLYDLITA